MYVLEKGDYPDAEAMGLLSPDSALRSVQPVGQVRIRPDRTQQMLGRRLTLMRTCPCPSPGVLAALHPGLQ